MEQMKRQRSNSFHDDDGQKKKTQATTGETDSASKEKVTCLEDLSNELIYEIFEFLDFYHVYETFSSFNTRFYNLITNSTVPINIYLSSISKSAFEKYNKDIIIPNRHRIASLHTSNICLYDHLFSPIHHLSKFHRLETLQLLNIESKYLPNLSALISLSYLSSLTISSVDCILDKNLIYLQILQLATLKYCNCSLAGATDKYSLPVAINEYSPIEHLIINDCIGIEHLNSLLSYVPRLRRLHVHLAAHSSVVNSKTCSSILNYLEHLSLDLISCDFDQFEQIIRNIAHQIEFLRITIRHTLDDGYTDVNRWERLILSHMPKLRIFDLRHGAWQHQNIIHGINTHQLTSTRPFDQFKSAFWMARRWFFTQQSYQSSYGGRTILYSTDPYRRKSYTLSEPIKERTCLSSPQTTFRSVRHVKIYQNDINKCQFYFPNATQVTLESEFSAADHSIAPMLSRLLHLDQLIKLEFNFRSFSLRKLIELLQFTPHLHTLIFQSVPHNRITSASILESETFALVSRTNTITDMTFKGVCTSDKVQLFAALSPRLQRLTIKLHDRDLQSVIQFLLDKTNPNTRHLSSLCLLQASHGSLMTVERLNNFKALPDDYLLKKVKEDLYLWW